MVKKAKFGWGFINIADKMDSKIQIPITFHHCLFNAGPRLSNLCSNL